MKLASLKQGRDGVLLVVSRDLERALRADDIAPTLQAALDDWTTCEAELQRRYRALNEGAAADSFALDMDQLASPLPRAYQWADGSAYINHVELVRQARGAQIPESFWHDPLMYQGGSDAFLGPREPIRLADTAWGIDFEGEVAVITGDVPMGCTPEQAAGQIRLLMLVNDVSLRGLIPAELAKGFGFFQSKPSSAFSPVAVTPDELGEHWRDGRVGLPLLVDYNGRPFGRANAGVDMIFNFPWLIAHAAKTRPLGAGAVIGSGTVSNKQDTARGSAIADGGVGYSCIAEVRMIETINNGKPETPFMDFGDTIRIRMEDEAGHNIFGDIEQTVERYPGP
ncbi:fumarylacetoacetate hydrolase family protein [Sedimenticola hydrogenitrophicus]|uniref:fumarylacetoacetate hydrolase family protein n=1 Tax=Sedimenticola hydrogenitrophicus TaxID=2967975 RepID=UPI0021A49729|nr:fumarylacetoacetate hydrolase family protein [Sedimenticola hydrogenitrophicus]